MPCNSFRFFELSRSSFAIPLRCGLIVFRPLRIFRCHEALVKERQCKKAVQKRKGSQMTDAARYVKRAAKRRLEAIRFPTPVTMKSTAWEGMIFPLTRMHIPLTILCRTDGCTPCYVKRLIGSSPKDLSKKKYTCRFGGRYIFLP